MAKVLVTGASGFIGRHLVSALVARGDMVACLVRSTSCVEWLKSLDVQIVQGDVCEPGRLADYVAAKDHVYHVAGCTMALTRREYYRVNQLGTKNVLTACAVQSTPPVVVFVSSLAAAGPANFGRPSLESDRPRPVSIYGRSKRAGEIEAETMAHRVPITIVRPPIVLGEGDKMGLSMFQSIERFGVHVVPSLGRNRFSVIHAADLVELLIGAAHRGRRLPPPSNNGRLELGQSFLSKEAAAISSQKSVNGSSRKGQGYYFAASEVDPIYDDLGRMIAQALGRRRVLPMHVAVPLVWMVSAGVEAVSRIERRPLYLHIDKAREITAGSWYCSSRAARDDFGFQVGATLYDRLRQTVDWYRRKGWL